MAVVVRAGVTAAGVVGAVETDGGAKRRSAPGCCRCAGASDRSGASVTGGGASTKRFGGAGGTFTRADVFTEITPRLSLLRGLRHEKCSVFPR